MDALSDILSSIKLKSSVYFREDFSSPWGMEMKAGELAQFHIAVRGHCWLKKFDGEMIELSTGDIIVFPLGDKHSLFDDPSSSCVSGINVLEAHHQNKHLFEGEKVSATLICGHFEFDKIIDHPFIKSLPRFIHITNTEQRQLSWLETATNVIMQETDSGNPGYEAVVQRLAEVLFIQVLRKYIEQKNFSTGFLSALNNHHLNYALSLIHKEPEDNWSLENLARKIGMSRSAFAAKFKEAVGLAPMEYITGWRMHKAYRLLFDTNLPLIQIAERVGYRSEAAFNRAFKRKYKQNPGVLRRHPLGTLQSSV